MAKFDVKKLRDTLKSKFEELGLSDKDVTELLDDEHKFGAMVDSNPVFIEYLDEEEGNDDSNKEAHLDSTGMNTIPVGKESKENILAALM